MGWMAYPAYRATQAPLTRGVIASQYVIVSFCYKRSRGWAALHSLLKDQRRRITVLRKILNISGRRYPENGFSVGAPVSLLLRQDFCLRIHRESLLMLRKPHFTKDSEHVGDTSYQVPGGPKQESKSVIYFLHCSLMYISTLFCPFVYFYTVYQIY